MRTAEEIKKGLEYIAETNVTRKVDLIRAGIVYQFTEDLAADALAYIKQLERENKDLLEERELNEHLRDKVQQLERERDAYFDSMKGICATCKKAKYCMLSPLPKCPNWQWRGVKEG